MTLALPTALILLFLPGNTFTDLGILLGQLWGPSFCQPVVAYLLQGTVSVTTSRCWNQARVR